jgi:putative FmdB family regulatory protein
MPTYEYLCKACGHEFERVQRITDDKIKTCPECKKRKVERLISQTSFVLKGGGWYSDLYSSSSDKKDDKAAAAEKGSDSKSESKSDSESKSESKPDSKPDSKSDKGKSGSKSEGGSKKSKGPKAAA